MASHEEPAEQQKIQLQVTSLSTTNCATGQQKKVSLEPPKKQTSYCFYYSVYWLFNRDPESWINRDPEPWFNRDPEQCFFFHCSFVHGCFEDSHSRIITGLGLQISQNIMHLPQMPHGTGIFA